MAPAEQPEEALTLYTNHFRTRFRIVLAYDENRSYVIRVQSRYPGVLFKRNKT